MAPVGDDPPAPNPPSVDAPRRNFPLLVAFQVMLRVGWIFKTESVVMPAVLDSIGAAAWVRALLPTLNRFGQTVPPMLQARRLERRPLKKIPLAFWTVLMGVPFLGLAAIWPLRGKSDGSFVFPLLFLVAYALFFAATGINQVGYATLQGKLIPPYRRGRLMSVANSIGVVIAVSCAALLMPLWMRSGAERFESLFLFTGCCFVTCGLIILAVRERPSTAAARRQADETTSAVPAVRTRWWTILRDDPRMRQAFWVGCASGCSLLLFPHYQPLARHRLGLGFDQMVFWVIVQNVGAACFGAPFGWLADRRGNRSVIRWATGLICLGPLLALAAVAWSAGRSLLPIAFFFLGLTPVLIKLLSNYVLELTDEARHPSYLATLGLALGLPAMIGSPLVGIAIDRWGFEPAFVLVAAVMTLGWFGSWRLVEPRSAEASGSDEEGTSAPSDG